MRHLLIINPAAGKGRRRKALLAQAQQGGYEVAFTEGAGHARALAEEAIAAGEPIRVYACGGDGTLNEVVNAAAGCPWAAVTNVPLGTGNDFLRIFGKEGRKRFFDLAALRDGPQEELDLMDCNGLLGLDVACVGLDSRVAAEVHTYKKIPLLGGTAAYITSLIANLSKGITRPMTVDMEDIHHHGPTAIVCVCNGRHYGGGFCPAPDAQPDDGILDMLLVGEVSGLDFVRYVGQYATGGYRNCPIVRHRHGQEVTISADEELIMVVDGEELRAKSITVRLSERKVNFFRPAGVFWRESSQTAHKFGEEACVK